jgi:dipeptidyl-peptidase-4
LTIDDTFPQQFSRTKRFSIGRPKHLEVSPDGQHVLFLRSPADAPGQSLWRYDVADGSEHLLADPDVLLGAGAEEDVPAEERARRERSRESGAGITAYTTDTAKRRVAFTIGGRLWVVDDVGTRELPAAGPVIDPQFDAEGTSIAYVANRALRVIDADGTNDRLLAEPGADGVSYGLAEYVAGEELGRYHGAWWSPDGDRLLVERADDSGLCTWYVSDPTDPAAPPVAMRYPQAGTANADVTLWLLGLGGSRVEVDWRQGGYEYVVSVHWDRHGLLVVVQNRAQTTMTVLAVDPATGATEVVRTDEDADWVPVVAGVPDRLDDGRLVWSVETADTRHLVVDGKEVTPAGLQLREVLGTDGGTVLFNASTEPTEIHLYTWSDAEGVRQVTTEPGVYFGALSGGTLLVDGVTMRGTEISVGGRQVRSLGEDPVVTPKVEWLRVGDTELRTAVLFPTGHQPGSGKLPVLLDPYGGPAMQRVLAMRNGFLVSQWFADLGFAVVVADGRGTPGRGPAWDRTIHFDKADPALEDQVTALHAAAERYPDLDLDRVGIRGWSYGGFLAAMAVLRRPEVFHAAVAGAPATDARLYNTYYQEKYLGHPDEHPEAYERATLMADAPNLTRPLMLIHGLADDNVLPAHTLRLSAALLAAAKPHTVLPLPATTHMAANANMLVLQARFLLDALSPAGSPA